MLTKTVANDEKLQERLALKAFVTSSLFLELKKDLIEYGKNLADEVSDNMNSAIGPDKLHKVNFALGQKSGVQWTLNILENYESDLLG